MTLDLKNSSQGFTVNGRGEAVIMLHSSLSTSKQWRTLCNQLKSHFQIINIDLLGYGNAPQVISAKDYSLQTEVIRIEKIIEQTIPEQSFHLVGHSFGGAIALKMAVENTARIRSLHLIEPVAFHIFEQGTKIRTEVDSFAQQVASLNHADAARHFTDTWNEKGFFDNLPVKMQVAMAEDIAKVNLDFIGLISEQYRIQDCARITCPVNLIHGTYSPVIGKEIINRLLDVLPDVVEYEVEAGHMSPISHPKEIANIISNYLMP